MSDSLGRTGPSPCVHLHDVGTESIRASRTRRKPTSRFWPGGYARRPPLEPTDSHEALKGIEFANPAWVRGCIALTQGLSLRGRGFHYATAPAQSA